MPRRGVRSRTPKGAAAEDAGSTAIRRRVSRILSRPDPSAWRSLADEELLGLRFCDLRLKIGGSMLQRCIDRLLGELEARSIGFRPHVWISSEFFSPDGVPGIAVPFYLTHPRLMRLEKAQMMEVEGGSPESCMRILRHEAGHALDTAYRLRRRKDWRGLFGRASTPYPKHYSVKPYSKHYVLHLDWWYGQSHPLEDFAETFAVWLRPTSGWRKAYRGWPAMRKLDYVEEVMQELRELRPAVRTRAEVDPIRDVKKTLREHYKARRDHYGEDLPDLYDADLRRLFPRSGSRRGSESAAAFLRRMRPDIRRHVAAWTGQHPYAVDLFLSDMMSRCRDLDLRVSAPVREVRMDAMLLVTVQMMTFMFSGKSSIAL